MRLLIAEDDDFFRRLLQSVLGQDHEVMLAVDGLQAWAMLQRVDSPRLAILDWVMPGMSGPQVCRKVRELPGGRTPYLIILTAKNSAADVISGLRAGADDYVTKPFDPEELRARVRVGERIVQLEEALQEQVSALHRSTENERKLASLLPVCPLCRRVRADGQYWLELEHYLGEGSHARPTTSCPACETAHRAGGIAEVSKKGT